MYVKNIFKKIKPSNKKGRVLFNLDLNNYTNLKQ